MNPLLFALFEAGLKIAKAHIGGPAGEVIETGGFLMEAAKAIDDLHREETGQPLDWDKIREHKHL